MPTPDEILANLATAKAAASNGSSETSKDVNPLEVKETKSEEKGLTLASTTSLLVVEETPVVKDELADCFDRANAILTQYGRLSDVPIDSEYWGLMNRVRALRNK